MIVKKDQITVEFGNQEGISSHTSDDGTRTIILDRDSALKLADEIAATVGLKLADRRGIPSSSPVGAKDPEQPTY